jgi:hypothetical protein
MIKLSLSNLFSSPFLARIGETYTFYFMLFRVTDTHSHKKEATSIKSNFFLSFMPDEWIANAPPSNPMFR